MKSQIAQFYNHRYMSVAQHLMTIAIRAALNISEGKFVFRGVISLAIFSSIKHTPPHHQLISCLLYKQLLTLGYKKDITIFAAKILTTILYGGELQGERDTDRSGQHQYKYVFSDFMSAIIPDISDFLITHAKVHQSVSDNYVVQYLLYVTARSVALILSAQILDESKYHFFAKGNYLALYGDLFNSLIPFEGVSVAKGYVPEICYNFCHSFVDAAVGSNLPIK